MQTLSDVGNWQILVVMLMMLFNLPMVFHVASPEVSAVHHEYWCRRMDNKFTLEQWLNISTVRSKDGDVIMMFDSFAGLTE
ncbi:Sugar (and other) transporter [Nesidiocoris tenuis]|uniref:Sugar (And other) transporter n=1 Tax=Nesidiocoris tenuis TaxID=355587 RepID=A0ABN7B8P0_9HEMI|nr:Sugar (and other) transporter [Nesidiocoris tenuis]